MAALHPLPFAWPAPGTCCRQGRGPPVVLVPGAGLTRLCCEVAHLGMHAQGNEFSYHMLLTSAFVLNEMQQPGLFTIYPWLHSNCNQISTEHQLRPVLVPDVPPTDLVPGANLLSMVAGDFTVSAPWRRVMSLGLAADRAELRHSMPEGGASVGPSRAQVGSAVKNGMVGSSCCTPRVQAMMVHHAHLNGHFRAAIVPDIRVIFLTHQHSRHRCLCLCLPAAAGGVRQAREPRGL